MVEMGVSKRSRIQTSAAEMGQVGWLRIRGWWRTYCQVVPTGGR